MHIEYSKSALKKVCTDIKKARKQYGEDVSEKLFSTINFIKSASNLNDIISFPPFHFHALKGKRSGQYAIDLGRRLGYRLIVVPLDMDGSISDNPQNPANSIKIVCVLIEEVTNHYE